MIAFSSYGYAQTGPLLGKDPKGIYIHVYNGGEQAFVFAGGLGQDNPASDLFGIPDNQTFQSYGFEIGGFKGAEAWGLDVRFGRDDGDEERNFFGTDSIRYSSSFQAGVLYRSRLVGTKTKSTFKFHIGGHAELYYAHYKGRRRSDTFFNDRTLLDITQNAVGVEFGPYIEMGFKGSETANGAVLFNFQLFNVQLASNGYGLGISRFGIIIQI